MGFFTGKFYDRNLAKLHFWLTFIGSNLTFLPMHWLGISGMPRRIPDYPDMYSGWNFICTVGSYINVLGLFIFFFLLILLFLNYTNVYLFKGNYLVYQDNFGELSFFNKIKSKFLVKNFFYVYYSFLKNNNNLFLKLNLNFMTNDIYFLIKNKFFNKILFFNNFLKNKLLLVNILFYLLKNK